MGFSESSVGKESACNAGDPSLIPGLGYMHINPSVSLWTKAALSRSRHNMNDRNSIIRQSPWYALKKKKKNAERAFPGGTSGKDLTCQWRSCKDSDSVPGPGRSSGEGNGNPFQFYCLENPMRREAWQATVVQGVAQSQTQLKRLSTHAHAVRILKWLPLSKRTNLQLSSLLS